MSNLLYTASKTAFVFVKNSTSNLIFCDSFGTCLLSTKVLDPPPTQCMYTFIPYSNIWSKISSMLNKKL